MVVMTPVVRLTFRTRWPRSTVVEVSYSVM
jgi:hypothetical protein